MIDHSYGDQKNWTRFNGLGKYRTTDWHENHMFEPSAVVPGSIMPAYKHLFKNIADIETAYAEAYTVKLYSKHHMIRF